MKKTLHTMIQIALVCAMLLGLALIVLIVTKTDHVTGMLLATVNGEYISGYISGGLAILAVLGGEYIAWTLFFMMRSLEGDPFVEKNVIRLRNMGIAALVTMVVCLATLLFRPVPLLVVGALPIGLCGLFSLVLCQVFSTAVAAKQENDLTV